MKAEVVVRMSPSMYQALSQLESSVVEYGLSGDPRMTRNAPDADKAITELLRAAGAYYRQRDLEAQ